MKRHKGKETTSHMSTPNIAAVTAPTTTDEHRGSPSTEPPQFTLSLTNFEGPFDLLLTLISRRKLDITDIALAEVTDEFITYINALYAAQTPQALDQASEFLTTAATLLELKTARLLPRSKTRTTFDATLIEARDLLFARLLQYRAYKEVTALLTQRWEKEQTRYARNVTLDPILSQALPELVFTTTPEQLAKIAARVLSPAPIEPVQSQPTEHLDAPATTIIAQEYVIMKLLEDGELNFTANLASAESLEVAIVRFLALLELYKTENLNIRQEDAGIYVMLGSGGNDDTTADTEEDAVADRDEDA